MPLQAERTGLRIHQVLMAVKVVQMAQEDIPTDQTSLEEEEEEKVSCVCISLYATSYLPLVPASQAAHRVSDSTSLSLAAVTHYQSLHIYM